MKRLDCSLRSMFFSPPVALPSDRNLKRHCEVRRRCSSQLYLPMALHESSSKFFAVLRTTAQNIFGDIYQESTNQYCPSKGTGPSVWMTRHIHGCGGYQHHSVQIPHLPSTTKTCHVHKPSARELQKRRNDHFLYLLFHSLRCVVFDADLVEAAAAREVNYGGVHTASDVPMMNLKVHRGDDMVSKVCAASGINSLFNRCIAVPTMSSR